MDDIVIQAMAKWPNVPDCYGWLGLDARGRWYLRDAQTQARGDFMQARGDRLEHPGLLAFIERNYMCDARGCWYFQNGPQRVFVELEAAPLVWRLQPQGGACAHTGVQSAGTSRWLVDERGWLYLDCVQGFGLVHSLDMELAARRIEQQGGEVQEVRRDELPARFGFVLSPAQLQA